MCFCPIHCFIVKFFLSNKNYFYISDCSNTTVHMNTLSSGANSFIVLPCYRRMTPEEDLIATLQGINLLVSQRQELVNQLTSH